MATIARVVLAALVNAVSLVRGFLLHFLRSVAAACSNPEQVRASVMMVGRSRRVGDETE